MNDREGFGCYISGEQGDDILNRFRREFWRRVFSILTFNRNTESRNKMVRYKRRRNKGAWTRITNFILNEDGNIFRRILRGMNHSFYEDFEDTAYRAYKLDNFRPEDFQALKQMGIRRMNHHALENALQYSSQSDDENTDPFKQVRNKDEAIRELVRAKSNPYIITFSIFERPGYRYCRKTPDLYRSPECV